MAVIVNSGTYEIDCSSFNLSVSMSGGDPIVMNDPPPMTMGSGTIMAMGVIVYSQAIDAAPAAGKYRYDSIQVGKDGIIDYVKGSALATPVYPAIVTDHIELARIFVKGGATAIYDEDISAVEWEAPYAASLSVTADTTFAWDSGNNFPQKNIKIDILDQYGQSIKSNYNLTLTKKLGSGQIYSALTGWDDDEVNQSIINGYSYTFKYRRDQTVTETSPVFQIELNAVNNLIKTFFMSLYDVDNVII